MDELRSDEAPRRIDSTIAALISARQRKDEESAVPSWRREELWRTNPSAAAIAAASETYVYKLDKRTEAPAFITIAEDHAEIGHRVWDGAVVLGKFLERHGAGFREHLRAGTVLELGAGSCLCSMVLAYICHPTTRFLATDVPAVVPHMIRSTALNSACGSVTPTRLVWGSEADEHAALRWLGESRTSQQFFDLIIASDMAAPIKSVPDFLQTLKRLLPPATPPCFEDSATSCRAAVDGRGAAAAASSSIVLPRPCFLVACQRHRDFTDPLLAGLHSAYGDSGGCVERVDEALLHPGFVSPRHDVYVVSPHWAH